MKQSTTTRKDIELLFKREKQNYSGLLCILKSCSMNNNVSTLHQSERDFLKTCTSERKQEILVSRNLAKYAVEKHIGRLNNNEIFIEKGIFGQPFLRHPKRELYMGISLAHKTNIYACVLFSDVHPVAVDIEDISCSKIKTFKRCFTKHEVSICNNNLIKLTTLWTAKEALSKVLQCGMTAPMRFLEVQCIHTEPNGFTGEFSHFNQYRYYSFIEWNTVITLVYPKLSVLETTTSSRFSEI